MGVGLGKYPIVTDRVRANVEQQAVTADTIEGLARKMEVPVKAFQATVERYNRMAGAGKDLDFGKRHDRMMPWKNRLFMPGRPNRSSWWCWQV
jgi:hypothetical protein